MQGIRLESKKASKQERKLKRKETKHKSWTAIIMQQVIMQQVQENMQGIRLESKQERKLKRNKRNQASN